MTFPNKQVVARMHLPMTQKEVATALATSRNAVVLEISKELKPQIQATMLRQFMSDVQRQVRTKSVVLAMLPQ